VRRQPAIPHAPAAPSQPPLCSLLTRRTITAPLMTSRHSQTLGSWKKPHPYLPFSDTNHQRSNSQTDCRDNANREHNSREHIHIHPFFFANLKTQPRKDHRRQPSMFVLRREAHIPWAHLRPHFADDPRISTNESFGLSGGIESSQQRFFTHSPQVSILLQIHPGIIGKRPAGLHPARRIMLKKDDEVEGYR
jgi:hypothetical protein